MTSSELGSLKASVAEAIAAAGLDKDTLGPEQLSAIDEIHLGGHRATTLLLDALPLTSNSRVLDIGCGLGGPARAIARRYGCAVTGIDIDPGFVEAATYLSSLTRLQDRTEFQVGSATDLPVEDQAFEAVTLLHVGMAIADKRRLFLEAVRVLRPGGTLLVYDVMRTGPGTLAYPVVWADGEAACFLAAPDAYTSTLNDTGFDMIAETDYRDLALGMSRRLAHRLAQPPENHGFSIRLVLGPKAPAKIANMTANLDRRLIAPIAMMARRR